jgi:hypothetical protein
LHYSMAHPERCPTSPLTSFLGGMENDWGHGKCRILKANWDHKASPGHRLFHHVPRRPATLITLSSQAAGPMLRLGLFGMLIRSNRKVSRMQLGDGDSALDCFDAMRRRLSTACSHHHTTGRSLHMQHELSSSESLVMLWQVTLSL